MDAGTGQRRLAPKSQLFAETSYPEPGVVPVGGSDWGGCGVADGDGSWETLLTILVHSSYNRRVLASIKQSEPGVVPVAMADGGGIS